MRVRTLAAASAIALIMVFMGGWAVSQEDVTVVNDSAFTKRTRPAAMFVHDAHNEKAEIADCAECHHGPDGTTSEGQECSECHKTGDSTRPLVKAYHGQCRGCHIEKKAGPVQCGECHSRTGVPNS